MIPSLSPADLREASRKLLFDEPGDGNVWAVGPNWKASIGAGEFHFIPFLGSDAPRNYPVEFSLKSVTVSGEELPLEADPMATREGRTITMDRASVREVYHANEAAIEQTFVFDSLPAAGEIIVRMAVKTELTPRVEGAGFSFQNERGGVQYGSAKAIGADGSRLVLEQEWVDGAIEIHVPASFVTPNAFPLTIDPIVSTLGVTSDARDQVNVDVAYDVATGNYLIVYEEVSSVNDHDVRSVFFNTSISALTDPAAINITSSNWVEPSVASSFHEAQFLTVATRGVSAGTLDVWGRTREAHTGDVGAQFQISTGAGDNAHSDVGGMGRDLNTSYSYFVVWENHFAATDDYDIYGQGVSANNALVGGLRGIATSGSSSDRNPSVSASSGDPDMTSNDHQYLVVWERDILPGHTEIWGHVTYYTGSLSGHTSFPIYTNAESSSPDVSSQTRTLESISLDATYVIVFERLRDGFREIFSVVAQEGDADNARSVTTMQDLAMGRHHADPKIANDGTGDYLVAYKSFLPGGFNAHVTALNIVRDSGERRTGLAERRASFPHPTGGAGAVCIASTYDGGSLLQSARAMAMWTMSSDTDEEVGAAIVFEGSATVDGSQYCAAADNSSGLPAWIRASSSFNSPLSELRIRVSDLPANAFGYVICSLDAGFTSQPGGSAGNLCLTGAIGRFSHQIANSGANGRVTVLLSPWSIPQPTGTTSAMAGDRWKFQYWTRDSQGGLPTSNFSNAVIVNFL